MVRRGIVSEGTVRVVITIDSDKDCVDVEANQGAEAMAEGAEAVADIVAEVASVRGMENTVKTAAQPASRHPLKG